MALHTITVDETGRRDDYTAQAFCDGEGCTWSAGSRWVSDFDGDMQQTWDVAAQDGAQHLEDTATD